MPGMLLFGRRWMIGSDDLFLPFLIAVSIRVTWLVAICSIVGVHHQLTHTHSFLNAGNSCGFKMDIYLLGYIIILTCTSFFDALIVYISSRGTIFREEKRRAMPGMIYGRLGIYVLELLWLAVGIYLLYTEKKQCRSTTDHLISEGLIICNILLFLCVFLFTYLSFDTAGHLWYKKETLSRSRNSSTYGSIYFNDMIKNRYEENWKRSCKTLFCCFKIESANENVFGFIARQFAESFHDQVNLVPSDIVAGLILLRKYQQVLEARQVQLELESRGASSSGVNSSSGKEAKPGKQNFKAVLKHQRTINWKPFDMGNEEQVKVLEKAVYFAAHTMAVYGWPGYLYRENVCSLGCCRLCCGVKCCCFGCPLRKALDIANIGDNCFECNIAATHLALGLEDVDLVHVSYHDEVFEPPFFVAVDHHMKAIVVSCRGTMSLKDVLTDLIIEEERIPVEDGDPAWKAHSGMLHSARYVLEHLVSGDLLSKAFAWDLSRGTNTYQLTLVGHSLGAGVASILAFLLRSKFPDLLCFAYSPPGITFNKAAAKYSEDFVYSIIVGKDVIPRLNLYTFHEMKFKLLRLIQETELPKWRIIRGCLCQCMLCCTKLNRVPHVAYLDIELPDLPPFGCDAYPISYVGGKIIHFVKTKSLYPRYIGKKRAEYEAVWASSEDFQSVLISTLMWKDHLPDTVFNTLQTFWKEQLAPSGVTADQGLRERRTDIFHGNNGAANGSEISPLVEDSTESHACVIKAPDSVVQDDQGACVDVSSAKESISDVCLAINSQESTEVSVLSSPTGSFVANSAMDSSRLPNENVLT